jgi:ectoine hydroxylase-related dioxygenase (phytanoyl-CoA dioxygenase family)
MVTLDDVDHIVTDAVRAEYWERGYWVSPRLLDDEQLARLRAAHDRLWAKQYDHEIPSQYGIPDLDLSTPVVRQFLNAFWLSDEIRAAVLSPVIGKIGARLMGVDVVRLWHDQAIYKPGIPGEPTSTVGNVGWHQDYGYWQCASTDNMCTAWVALQDTDLSNGGMRTIVGSHKWGLIPIDESDTFKIKDLEALSARFAAAHGKPDEWLEEPCILKAGEASFHHSLCFHGSGPNTSAEPRLSVISHMMPGDTVYRAGRRRHPNDVFLGPNAHEGQPFIGVYWPQMWPVIE